MPLKGLILPQLIWLWTCSIPTSHILGVQSSAFVGTVSWELPLTQWNKAPCQLEHRKHTRNLPYWLWQDYRLLALAQIFEPHQALNWGFAFPWGWFVLESPSKWVEWGGSVWPQGTKLFGWAPKFTACLALFFGVLTEVHPKLLYQV